MQVAIDVNTRRLGMMTVAIDGVSDVADPDADVIISSIVQAIADSTGEKRSRAIVDASVESGRLVAVITCVHIQANSMRGTASIAKSGIENAGHSVAYTETEGWTDIQKQKSQKGKVPGMNVGSIV
jgi:hypothetical protein